LLAEPGEAQIRERVPAVVVLGLAGVLESLARLSEDVLVSHLIASTIL